MNRVRSGTKPGKWEEENRIRLRKNSLTFVPGLAVTFRVALELAGFACCQELINIVTLLRVFRVLLRLHRYLLELLNLSHCVPVCVEVRIF